MMNFKHGEDFLRCKCARAEQATDIMSSMQCSPFLSAWPTSAPEIAALRSLLPIPFCYFIAPATALKTGGGKEGSAALERGAASSHELSLHCLCFLVTQLNFWKHTVVVLCENCHGDRQPVFTVSLWRRFVHFNLVTAEMWVFTSGVHCLLFWWDSCGQAPLFICCIYIYVDVKNWVDVETFMSKLLVETFRQALKSKFDLFVNMMRDHTR